MYVCVGGWVCRGSGALPGVWQVHDGFWSSPAQPETVGAELTAGPPRLPPPPPPRPLHPSSCVSPVSSSVGPCLSASPELSSNSANRGEHLR